ncbi:MAG TPA: alpha/beta fold hydrolase, partial [Methylobacter sp.]
AVFLARQQDLDWFAKDGASRIYPEQWQRLIESVPEQSRGNLVQGLCDILWGEDEVAQRRVAKEWMAWGSQVSLGNDYQPGSKGEHATEQMVKQACMELHYAKCHYFIKENQILDSCGALDKIPMVIIHGRHDFVCPMEAGYSLHARLPNAEYIILPNAGHIAQGAEMINALVVATDRFAGRGDNEQN